MRIVNYYYFIAGILAALFTVTHAWNGHVSALPKLYTETELEMQIMFTYVWHIITVENLIFGIVFIFLSIFRGQSKAQLAAWVIVCILIFRFVVILGVTIWMDASMLTDTLVDSAAIVIYVVLIIMGIRMQRKHLSQATETA